MSTHTTVVQSHGIFHGLPVYPESVTGLRAMVVGASGQSGQPLIDLLSGSPKRWGKVYAMSRRPPKFRSGSNIEHIPVDLLWDSDKISKLLLEHQVQVDYIFYFGYIQIARSEDAGAEIFGNAEHLAKVNGSLFESFLDALDKSSVRPKRIVLQTGGKNYGVHQGHVDVPLREASPRVELEPNFYYTQEDLLAKYIKTHPETNYNVTMPQWILAAVAGTDMTIFYPLAVYAAVQHKLKQPLKYPGDLVSWDNNHPISTGLLNGMFYEWLVLTPETAGESFNITDGSEFSFGKFWPVLASWYGLEWSPPKDDDAYSETIMPFVPRGYGPHGRLRSSFSFFDWAKQTHVRDAWAELSREHNLTSEPLKDPEKTFGFLQFALELTWSWATSIDKARKFGWLGHCDSVESMRIVFEKFADMKMLPPVPN